MFDFPDKPGGWGRARRMARVLGVDPVAAVLDGWLKHPELETMVDRCDGCVHGGKCTLWLVRTRRAVEPPEFCDKCSVVNTFLGEKRAG